MRCLGEGGRGAECELIEGTALDGHYMMIDDFSYMILNLVHRNLQLRSTNTHSMQDSLLKRLASASIWPPLPV